MDDSNFGSKVVLGDYPFTVPKHMPVTKNLMQTNSEKLRNIACPTCKYQMLSHVYAPICGVCGHEMLTIAIVM